MIAKREEQKEKLRLAGKLMAEVVREVLAIVKPGVASMALDKVAAEAIVKRGANPSFLGYKAKGEHRPYPASICVSINDEVVHSPPTPEKILQEGDIVSLDFGLVYEGAFMDTAHTLAVGKIDARGMELIDATKEALAVGIAAAKVGGHIGDIGAAVSEIARQHKLGIIKTLSGHGVGAAVHEPPYVPNFGKVGEGEEIPDGMVIAIEPMFTEGSGELIFDKDGYTFRSKDGSRGAHFEHTVLIAKNGVEILTAL
jgi:methionyl aminopeptidase